MEQNRTESVPQTMRLTKLPISLEGRTVGDMMPGETRAVQVHAMVIDTDYDPWLRSGYKTYRDASETHPLVITRMEDGYEVDATKIDDDGWFRSVEKGDFSETEEGSLLKVLGITIKFCEESP